MNNTRTLTALEIELLAIVKRQSAKLIEASEHIAHMNGYPEAIADFKGAADVSVYLEQYGIDPTQIASVDTVTVA